MSPFVTFGINTHLICVYYTYRQILFLVVKFEISFGMKWDRMGGLGWSWEGLALGLQKGIHLRGVGWGWLIWVGFVGFQKVMHITLRIGRTLKWGLGGG